jgi:hypothetical protein
MHDNSSNIHVTVTPTCLVSTVRYARLVSFYNYSTTAEG